MMEKTNFEHKKSLGQNFLNSEYVPRKMCDAADIAAEDTVLEIGPGTGALTRELLARGATVIAVETDQRAIEVLTDSFSSEIASGTLRIVHADARELDVSSLGLKTGQFKIVANIPYYLSGLLLRICLDTQTQPSSLVFLIQKELAERIARSKKESLLSLSVKVFGDPTYIRTIKRSHFTPQPNVDSAILLIRTISREKLASVSSEAFFDLLHLGFGSKRKQLQHNLRQEYDKELVFKALQELSLSETVRAEDISLEDWIQLTRLIHQRQ